MSRHSKAKCVSYLNWKMVDQCNHKYKTPMLNRVHDINRVFNSPVESCLLVSPGLQGGRSLGYSSPINPATKENVVTLQDMKTNF